MRRKIPLAQLLLAVGAFATGAFVMSLIGRANGDEDPQFAFDDVREYCSTFDTLDEPDIRWVGEPTPGDVRDAAVDSFTAEIVAPNEVLWRCMDGEVWWCLQWGTNWCPKRDVSLTPNDRLYRLCGTATDRALSRAEQGQATVWMWSCKSGRPVVESLANGYSGLDRRYFTSALWVNLDDGRNPDAIQ
jgi:hypothetical protein